MSSYNWIRQTLESIEWIDGHSHVLHHNIEKEKASGSFEVLPLSHLLLDFNNRMTYVTAGMKMEMVQDILNGRISPSEQKRILLSYPGVQSHIAYLYLMRGLRELYHLDVWRIDSENWDLCNRALSHSRNDFYALVGAAYENGGIRASILNLWAGKGARYLEQYRAELSDREQKEDNRFFLFCATFDFQAMLPFSELTMQYAERFQIEQDTFDGYAALLERLARYFVEEKGVRGFKITEMYHRRLDYAVVTAEEARPCYRRERTPEQNKALSDFTAGTIFRLAAQYHVPVQIHTGSRWGDFAIEDVNPAYLGTAIAAFPDTKFDLLHAGDPFYGVTAVMGESFPNVYLNLSALPLNSYDTCMQWLGRYLDRIPSSKISLGWDVFAPELICGAAHFSRDILAKVLAHKVDAGLYSFDMAIDVAHNLMHGTVESLYGEVHND